MLVYIEGVYDQISVHPRYFFIYLYCYCYHHNRRVYVFIIHYRENRRQLNVCWRLVIHCSLCPIDAAFYSYMKQLSGY